MKYLGIMVTMLLVVSLLFTACQPAQVSDDVAVDMDLEEIDALEAELDSLLDSEEFSDLEAELDSL
jgi:hypothetical protein